MLAHSEAEIDIARPENTPEYVSVAYTARRLGTSERFVRERIACGDLPAVKVGAKAIRIRWADVENLLKPVVSAAS